MKELDDISKINEYLKQVVCDLKTISRNLSSSKIFIDQEQHAQIKKTIFNIKTKCKVINDGVRVKYPKTIIIKQQPQIWKSFEEEKIEEDVGEEHVDNLSPCNGFIMSECALSYCFECEEMMIQKIPTSDVKCWRCREPFSSWKCKHCLVKNMITDLQCAMKDCEEARQSTECDAIYEQREWNGFLYGFE